MHANADFVGECAEAACTGKQSESTRPVARSCPCGCVGSYRGWAAVDGGDVCSQGLEERLWTRIETILGVGSALPDL